MPTRHDLTIYRGDYFAINITFKTAGVAQDLTGLPIQAQIRQTTSLTAPLLAQFNIDRDDVNGTITLKLNPADTQKLADGDYVYDLQVGEQTYLSGTLTLIPDVTR